MRSTRGTGRLARLCVLAGFWAWTGAPHARAQPSTPLVDLAARVAARIGGDARDCGQLLTLPPRPTPAASDLERAIGCGRMSAQSRQPFWLVIAGNAVESWRAEGLFSGADGVQHHFTYDSWKENFAVVPCPVPKVNPAMFISTIIVCETP